MIPQSIIAAKSQELHQSIDQLITRIADEAQRQTPIHEIESQTFQMLLQAGRIALQLVVEAQGTGDVGDEHTLDDGRTLKRSLEPQVRRYVSIFGVLDISRYVYASRDGQKIEFVPVDARLALPENAFSYLLQDWDQHFAMEQPFAQVRSTVAKIFGLHQSVDSLERMNRTMARPVESFHMDQTPPPEDEEGEILVQTADGKGVPIRHAADAPSIRDHRHQRGPKPDRKKVATIGAVYTVDPFYRTPEELLEALFRDPQQPGPAPRRPQPCHKRMRAMLNHVDSNGDWIDGRAAVFGWIASETAQRCGGGLRPIVCLMDGGQSLWDMRDMFQEDVDMIDILDLLHVTPRIWDAAALFYARNSAEAEQFVRDRTLRILRGEVKSVICGLRRMRGTRRLTKAQRASLEVICKYLAKNAQRMKYDEYLARGYPIASGVIEGACRHVVKDRLERTGMSWIRAGAQPMLELRCLYVTDQWQDFHRYRIEKEIERLYPYRESLDPLPWNTAA